MVVFFSIDSVRTANHFLDTNKFISYLITSLLSQSVNVFLPKTVSKYKGNKFIHAKKNVVRNNICILYTIRETMLCFVAGLHTSVW